MVKVNGLRGTEAWGRDRPEGRRIILRFLRETSEVGRGLFAEVMQVIFLEGLSLQADWLGQFGVVEVGVASIVVVLVLGLDLVGIVTPPKSVR